MPSSSDHDRQPIVARNNGDDIPEKTYGTMTAIVPKNGELLRTPKTKTFSPFRNCLRILFGVLFIFVPIAIAILVVIAFIAGESGKMDEGIKCRRADYDRPVLLVVSFDGFGHDFWERGIFGSLDRVFKDGSTAEWMYPVYPTKTFPNHYSLATGLFPEIHGIVDNFVFDPNLNPEVVDIKRPGADPRFYKGEPIWNTVKRHGLKSATLFWPGSKFEINGQTATYNLIYNKSIPILDRIKQITDWLLLPKDDRPALIMVYFERPDSLIHNHRVEDEEVTEELHQVDSIIEHLTNEMRIHNLLDCTNLLIVSDHGLHNIDTRIYLDELLVDNKNNTGLKVIAGPVLRIHLGDSGLSLESLMSPLICANNGSLFRLFDRENIPKRCHYSNTPRIGDLLLQGQPGVTFYKSKTEWHGGLADHGWDYLSPSMRALFFARGPAINAGIKLEPFFNYEIYNLMIDLIQIPRDVPNNGTIGIFDPLLRGGSRNSVEDGHFPIDQCTLPYPEYRNPAMLETCSSSCQTQVKDLSAQITQCPIAKDEIFALKAPGLCTVSLCGTLLGYDSRQKSTKFWIFTNRQKNWPNNLRLDERCLFKFSGFDGNCEERKHQFGNIINEKPWNQLVDARMPLHQFFINVGLKYLEQLTEDYKRRFFMLPVITGPIYDFDYNGIGDSLEEIERQNTSFTSRIMPTHIFRVFLRCIKFTYDVNPNEFSCKNDADLRIIAFILPNSHRDLNCLKANDYLLQNTATVRDVERLTGMEFFTDRRHYSREMAIKLRTHIPYELW